MPNSITCKNCGAQPGSQLWRDHHRRTYFRQAITEAPEPYVTREIDTDVGVFCSELCLVVYVIREYLGKDGLTILLEKMGEGELDSDPATR